jgi:hypothetical protein
MSIMAVAARAAAKSSGAGQRIVSIAAWAVAVWTTESFFRVLAGGGAFRGETFLAAILGQAIFTWAESPVWRGRGKWWGFTMLGIDSITNVGGLFVYILRLDQTDSWRAFNTGLGLTGGINPLAALIVSVVIGILLAAAPEYLWKGE